MASPHLELVQSISAAWERGDYSGAEWADPEIEYVIADGPSPGSWKGLAGLTEGARHFVNAWKDFHIKVEQDLELDHERVLVLVRYSGRGRTSGLRLDDTRSKGATLFQVRAGKVTRCIQYLDRDRALADLGLASEPDSPSSPGASSANVELVRSICTDWQRGDYSSAEWADPEIEFVLADGPDPGSWKGLAGMAQAWRSRLATWEEFHQQAFDFREIDHERVLVLFRVRGRGKTSGLELTQMHPQSAAVFQLRDGKVTRFIGYFERDRALADLGLPADAIPREPHATKAGPRADQAARPRRSTGAGEGALGTPAEIVTDEPQRLVEIKVDREELVLTESRYGPGESGPEPHVHREHSDSFYVLDGELVFEVAEERVVVADGGFVLVPPGLVHTFRNEGPADARFLNAHTPGCRFADHLRGKDVDFDTFDPPEDGGRPASDAVVVSRSA
jgi:mannose-6-phosphate isomerase-like protein (cupin superfamily)/ketosteroid isomerase-like protein